MIFSPGHLSYALNYTVLFKSDENIPHRKILEDNKIDQREQQKQIQLIMSLNICAVEFLPRNFYNCFVIQLTSPLRYLKYAGNSSLIFVSSTL